MAEVLPFMRYVLRRFSGASTSITRSQCSSLSKGSGEVCNDRDVCGGGSEDRLERACEQWSCVHGSCDSCRTAAMSPSCSICRERIFPESEIFPEACSSCGSYVHLKCDPEAEPVSDDSHLPNLGDAYVCKVCKAAPSEFNLISDSKEGSATVDDDCAVDTSQDSWSSSSPSQVPKADDMPPLVSQCEISDGGRKFARKCKPSSSQAASKFGPPLRKGKKAQLEIRGVFGQPGISLEGPSRDGDDVEENEREEIMVVCSSKDSVAVSYDLCVMCGSIGQGQEGRLIPCAQCGQAYHPYCLEVKLTPAMLNNGWRCPSCACCEKCGKEDSADDMVFCEDCSVSIHLVCLNPAQPSSSASQPWRCRACALCEMCGKTEAGSCPVTGHWGTSFVCSRCSSAVDCRICGRSYVEQDLIIRCPSCGTWLHAACDEIKSEEEAETCVERGYSCRNCRSEGELPPHLKPTLVREQLPPPSPSNTGSEEASDREKPPPLPPLVVRFRRHLQSQSFELASAVPASPTAAPQCLAPSAGGSCETNPSGSGTPPSFPVPSAAPAPRHCVDGVCLSETGAKKIRDLIKTHSDGGSGKRIYRKRTNNEDLPGMKSDASSDPGGTESPAVKRGTSEAARKRKQKALQRCGIGGFSIKVPKSRAVPGPSSECASVVGMKTDDSTKKTRKRKARSKILEYLPGPIQEAFFGRKMLDSVGGRRLETESLDLGESVDDACAAGTKSVALSQEDLELIGAMQEEREIRRRQAEEDKEVKDSERQKRRESRLLRIKGRQAKRRRKSKAVEVVAPAPDSAANHDENMLECEEAVVDPEGDMQGDSWQDMILNPDIFNDVMVDSLLEAEMEDGQLGFDDDPIVVEKEDHNVKLEESGLGASSVADSGISESGPDSTPHTSHAKDELTDYLLHESFDDTFPAMDTKDLENVFNGVVEEQLGANAMPNLGTSVQCVENATPHSVPPDLSYGYDDPDGLASVLSSHSQESGQFETYSFSSQSSVNPATPTQVPATPAKKEPRPLSKSLSKWEAEEGLGGKATIAPMLFANTCRPDLMERYPVWSERQRQIGKAWRALSKEERSDFVKRARDNRAASNVTKPSAGQGSSCPTPAPPPPPTPSWSAPPPPPPVTQIVPQHHHSQFVPDPAHDMDYDPTLDMVMSKQKQLRDFLHNQQQQQYNEQWCAPASNVTEYSNHQAVFRPPAPSPTTQQQTSQSNYTMSVPPPPPYEQMNYGDQNVAYGSKLKDDAYQKAPLLLEDLLEQEKQEQCKYVPVPEVPPQHMLQLNRAMSEEEYCANPVNAVPNPGPMAITGRGVSSSQNGIQAPAPATPCAVSPMPPPSPPPKTVSTDDDRRKQRQYEQWLTQNAQILSMRQAHYQSEVDRFRKVRRAILARQRQMRKSSMELGPQDSATLEKITADQSELQKQLDQCRKAMKQHSTLMNEYSAKNGPLAPPPVQETPPTPIQQQTQPPPPMPPANVHPLQVGPSSGGAEYYPPPGAPQDLQHMQHQQHQHQMQQQPQPRYHPAMTTGGVCGNYVAASPLRSPMAMTPSPGASYHHPYPSPQQASVPPMVSPGIPYLNDDSAGGMGLYHPSGPMNGQTCLPPHSSPGYQSMHPPSVPVSQPHVGGYGMHGGMHDCRSMMSPQPHYSMSQSNGGPSRSMGYSMGHPMACHQQVQMQQQSPHYGEQPPVGMMTSASSPMPMHHQTIQQTQPLHHMQQQQQPMGQYHQMPSSTAVASTCGMQYNQSANATYVQSPIQQQPPPRPQPQPTPAPQVGAGPSMNNNNRGGGNPNHPFLPCLRIFGGNFKLGLRGGSPFSPGILSSIVRPSSTSSGAAAAATSSTPASDASTEQAGSATSSVDVASTSGSSEAADGTPASTTASEAEKPSESVASSTETSIDSALPSEDSTAPSTVSHDVVDAEAHHDLPDSSLTADTQSGGASRSEVTDTVEDSERKGELSSASNEEVTSFSRVSETPNPSQAPAGQCASEVSCTAETYRPAAETTSQTPEERQIVGPVDAESQVQQIFGAGGDAKEVEAVEEHQSNKLEAPGASKPVESTPDAEPLESVVATTRPAESEPMETGSSLPTAETATPDSQPPVRTMSNTSGHHSGGQQRDSGLLSEAEMRWATQPSSVTSIHVKSQDSGPGDGGSLNTPAMEPVQTKLSGETDAPAEPMETDAPSSFTEPHKVLDFRKSIVSEASTVVSIGLASLPPPMPPPARSPLRMTPTPPTSSPLATSPQLPISVSASSQTTISSGSPSSEPGTMLRPVYSVPMTPPSVIPTPMIVAHRATPLLARAMAMSISGGSSGFSHSVPSTVAAGGFGPARASNSTMFTSMMTPPPPPQIHIMHTRGPAPSSTMTMTVSSHLASKMDSKLEPASAVEPPTSLPQLMKALTEKREIKKDRRQSGSQLAAMLEGVGEGKSEMDSFGPLIKTSGSAALMTSPSASPVSTSQLVSSASAVLLSKSTASSSTSVTLATAASVVPTPGPMHAQMSVSTPVMVTHVQSANVDCPATQPSLPPPPPPTSASHQAQSTPSRGSDFQNVLLKQLLQSSSPTPGGPGAEAPSLASALSAPSSIAAAASVQMPAPAPLPPAVPGPPPKAFFVPQGSQPQAGPNVMAGGPAAPASNMHMSAVPTSAAAIATSAAALSSQLSPIAFQVPRVVPGSGATPPKPPAPMGIVTPPQSQVPPVSDVVTSVTAAIQQPIVSVVVPPLQSQSVPVSSMPTSVAPSPTSSAPSTPGPHSSPFSFTTCTSSSTSMTVTATSAPQPPPPPFVEGKLVPPPSADPTASALLASALSQDPSLIKHEAPVMTTQAAILEAEKILKMAGIKTDRDETIFTRAEGSSAVEPVTASSTLPSAVAQRNEGGPWPNSDVTRSAAAEATIGVGCAVPDGKASEEATNESGLSEAELKKQKDLEARRAKRRLYQKKRRMMENERKAAAKAAAENGGVPATQPSSNVGGGLAGSAPFGTLTADVQPGMMAGERRPGAQKAAKRPSGSANSAAVGGAGGGNSAGAASASFSPGRATPIGGTNTVPVGAVSPSGGLVKKKSRKQSAKVDEVDYDTFLEGVMQQLRGMNPLTLGEPLIPADVSEPVLPSIEEPKVTEPKKAGQMLSNREERYDWLSTTGRLVGEFGRALYPSRGDYYEDALKANDVTEKNPSSANASEQHLKYYSLEFGPHEFNSDGSLNLDATIAARRAMVDPPSARATPQSMANSKSLFSPTLTGTFGFRRRSLDSPDSFVSTSSPECVMFDDDDEGGEGISYGPRKFYPGLWSPTVEEGQGEVGDGPLPAKRRRRMAAAGGSPIMHIVAPIPVRGDEIPPFGGLVVAAAPNLSAPAVPASVAATPLSTTTTSSAGAAMSPEDKENASRLLVPLGQTMAPGSSPPPLPLRENNAVAVTLTLSSDRVKDVTLVLGKLSAMLGIPTPVNFEIDELPTDDGVSPPHGLHANNTGGRGSAVMNSGTSTPMDVGEGGKDEGSDSVSLSSLVKQASSCSSVSSGSLDNDRYCKHCDVLIGVGTNEVRKSAKDFGIGTGDEDSKEEYVFCSTNCYMQFALIKRVSVKISDKDVDVKTEPKDDDEDELKREIEVLGLGGVGRPEIKLEDDVKPRYENLGIIEEDSSSLLPPADGDGGRTTGTVVEGDSRTATVEHDDYAMLEDDDDEEEDEEEDDVVTDTGAKVPTFRMRVAPNRTRSFLIGLPETVPAELRERLDWLKDPQPTPSPESILADEEEDEAVLSSSNESGSGESSDDDEAGGPKSSAGTGDQDGGRGKSGKDADKRAGSAMKVASGGAGGPGGSERDYESGRLSTPQEKRWKGVAYKYFDYDDLPVTKKNRPPTENELTDMLFRMGICLMPTWDSLDQRECAFCGVPGDGSSDGPARLLNLDVDKWVHLNCALWTDDVYETTSGALVNVQDKLKQNAHFTCSLCERPGASVHCFKLRCTNYYHLGCASKAGCVFYKNKTVFCQQHVQRSEKENELTTLCVFRRVYVERDEERQIASMMHLNDSDNYLLRVGSLIFMDIGQLLPQQLQSPSFHTQDCVYPVGYKAVRIYWSFRRLNKRCCYECTISESDGHPVFNVKCRERDLEEVTFSGGTPKEAWNHILEPIARMRLEAGIIKMFPQYITGDDLFGLTEPAVVKILESLPGLETLTDYRFKYGRNPMFEMPLAINPSGCARAEPRGRTHVKRPHTQRAGPVARASGPVSAVSPSTSTLLSSVHAYDPYGLYGKQFVHSKSSQYKKMKQEWRNNVYLARSKIQGLGLYAARDIERNTMIIEYIGEIIRPQIAELREKRYEAANRGIYMFRLDEDRVIDATLKGGLARYINHCCNPNCVAEAIEVDRDVKIIIFSKCRISRGEELAYDYRFDLEDDQHKIPCMCGASNCKKWMN